MARAVFVSTNAWRSPARVGTHHLADHLAARDWEILWLCAPFTPLHLPAAGRSEVRAKLSTWWSPGVRPVEDHAPFTAVPMGGPLGFRSAAALRWWHQLTVPRVGRLLRRWRGAALLVCDSPLYWFAAATVKAHRTVYRMTDYTPGFAGASPALLDREAVAVRQADVVMATTPTLEDYAVSLGARRTVVIPNGVDVDQFSASCATHAALDGIPRPRAIYVGSLREWFDDTLVNRLVAERTNLSVIIVGPDHGVRSRLRDAPNLHVLGPRPYAEVPSLLQSCDLGLIPFDTLRHADLLDQVDPLKLHEYLAAGLPVVASRWKVLEEQASPALLAGGHDTFIAAVDDALARSAELSEAGRAFAARADWRGRFDELLRAIELPAAQMPPMKDTTP